MNKPSDFKTQEPVLDRKNFRADGICYDEIGHFKIATKQLMVNRGLVWKTLFYVNGQAIYGSVIAPNFKVACDIVDGRGLGEKVIDIYHSSSQLNLYS